MKKGKIRHVLVTGAAGCVGHLVVGELLERGYRVRALDRPGADFEEWPEDRVEIVEGDLTDRATARSAVAGMDAVVHTAACVDIAKTFEELAPINLDAVRDLYEAGKDHLSVFIHFGTGSAYAAGPHPHKETDPFYEANDYIRTKILSEDDLRSRPATGPRVNIVRPALIFGPKGRVLLAPLATLAPLLEAVGGYAVRLSGGPRTNLVHAEDVARAAVHLLENPQPHGEAFNVANDDVRPIGDLVTEALELGGVSFLPITIPYPRRGIRWLKPLSSPPIVFQTVNALLGSLWEGYRRRHRLEAGLRLWIDREALDFAYEDTIFDNAKIKGTGFSLKYPDFRSGWLDTLRWYERAGWLPAHHRLEPGETPDEGVRNAR